MEQFAIFRLTNMSPLHMGLGKDDYDFSAYEVCSDTLSAALAAMRVRYRGKTEDVKEFLSSFRISSCFPYAGDEFFLPRPQGRIKVEMADACGNKMDETLYRKRLKKVRYVSHELFPAIAKGETLRIDASQLDGDFLFAAPGEHNKPYQKDVRQRVKVPLEGSADPEPFYFEWYYFQERCGLYCVARAEETILCELEDLLCRLGIEGIGTDRNVGGGKFDVQRRAMEMPDVENANAMLLLSLYIPTPEELEAMDLERSRYTIVRRGGYMAGSDDESLRHLRKKNVYMFSTGSVLKTSGRMDGDIVDVCSPREGTTMHSVWRSGHPLTLPILINE